MIEELANGDSFIRRLDPRGKIVVVFLFSMVVAAANRLQVLLCALLLGLLIVLAAKVPVKELVKRLIPVNMLILFLWFFLPFTFGGEPFFHIGPLAVTREGLLYATRITLKSNAMMLMLIALVASTPIFTMGHAMYSLGIPKKIVHLFFFTYLPLYSCHIQRVFPVEKFNESPWLYTQNQSAYLQDFCLYGGDAPDQKFRQRAEGP